MIVKIWPIKAKHGSVLKNIKDSIDYANDPEKLASTSKGQDLQLEYDNLSSDEQESLTWEEFKINNEDNFNRVIDYAANADKTDGYVSGYLCDPAHAAEEFIQTKQINLARVGKELKDDTGNHAYHLVQSFPEELNISDEEIHRCGQELVEKLGKYQAVICSHVHPVIDDEKEVHGKCKHNHIIINSHIHHELVDNNNPAKMKYHDCKETYALLQLYNDQIAIEHGLPIIVSQDLSKAYSWFETMEKNKGKSWKERVRVDIENTMRVSNNFEEYSEAMTNIGYSLRIGNSQQNGQYITYTTPNGKKVRDYILGQTNTFEQLQTYWEIKANLAQEILKNSLSQNKNPLKTIIDNTNGQVFIDIKRSTGNSRKKRMEAEGKQTSQYFHYHFPVPFEYDESLQAEKTYFETHETYEILNDQNQVLASLTGREILNYYRTLEEEQLQKKQTQENEFYINSNFRNYKTNRPYRIAKYDENGRRRSTVELVCILAIVILNKEDQYFGINEDQLTPEQKNDPIYAQRDWKLQNMVDTLKVAREEQIHTPGDIEDRLNQTGKNVSKAKAEIRRLTNAYNNMTFLKESIEKYLAVKTLCEGIFNMPEGKNKEEMKKRHAVQISTYNQAKAAMYRHKVLNDEQIDDVERRYHEIKNKIEYAQDQLDDYKEEYRKLSKLRYNVQLAQNKQYVYGPNYHEQQNEKSTENRENLKEPVQ